MDCVFIEDLRVEALIGVYDWERTVKQVLSFDVQMATESHTAASSDDIQYALDYGEVAARITQLVESSAYQLVEALAEAIVTMIREEFGVPWVRLVLRKPGAVINAVNVGLIIERGEKAAL